MTLLGLSAIESELAGENSNFIIHNETTGVVDFNRFRSSLYVEDEEAMYRFNMKVDANIYAAKKAIIDLQKTQDFSLDVPFDTVTKTISSDKGIAYASLYRLYGVMQEEAHRLSVGLQRVAFGVGRIFTPVDIYNPYNALSLEPSERKGVFGAHYTYNLNELSDVEVSITQDKDRALKSGFRLKGSLLETDMAIIGVSQSDLTMVGYEVEGDFKGIGLRSEGGYFRDRSSKVEYINMMLGADYGFEHGGLLMVEFFKRDDVLNNIEKSYAKEHYLALNYSDMLTVLLSANLITLYNLDDSSAFVSPNLLYSLSDEMTLSLGALVGNGENGSEFKRQGESYYLNWVANF